MTELRISDDLALPLDAVTETFALIAKRRVGKSNAAVVMAEQMYDAGIPWVAIDPKGDWYGVRSSADGEHDGLSVVVFGGEHGDVPLSPDAGAYMADLIANERITCVLDVSQFSKADEVKLLYAFATRLLQVNRDPLHIFFEECDDYIPQSMVRDNIGGVSEAQLVRSFSKLVRHGGFRGIGCTLITQRPALVNNNVLSQTETMILLRTTMPRDVDEVGKWLKGHSMAKEIIASLPTLKVGQAWVVSPAFLELVQQITFARRRTFDSAATPKMGEKRVEPRRLADVDLAAIKEQMAETIEKAKADDPKELRRQIAELKRDLQSAREMKAEAPEPLEVRVEVPVLGTDGRKTIELLIEHLRRCTDASGDAAIAIAGALGRFDDRGPHLPRAGAASGGARAVAPPRPAQRPDPPERREPRRAAVPGAAPADLELTGVERKLLGVLYQLGGQASGRRFATLSNYHERAKSFTNAKGHLRTLGLITGTEPVELTDTGMATVATLEVEPLPTGRDLVEHWKSQPKIGGVAGRILDVLYDAYPAMVPQAVLAEEIGYHPRAKSFTNALGQVRSLGLVHGRGDVVLDDDLGAS